MVRYDRRTAQRGAKYVDDRRGQNPGRRRPRVGGRGGQVAVGGGGAVILALVLGLCSVATGGNGIVGGAENGAIREPGRPAALENDVENPFSDLSSVERSGNDVVDPDSDAVEFLQFLMVDIQETWDQLFEQAGLSYQFTTLVIMEDVVDTGCGQATSDVGPFYCPAPGDNQVYIDLSFFDELATRFGAPGDFAIAYVVAHEVGHHVQSVTGISTQVRQYQASDPANSNDYAIRLELQADCLAGVWANSANGRLTEVSGQPIIEPGDIEEGLEAASAVGDDRLQAQAGVRVNPDSWTHGSSEQRMRWFTIGFETGDPEQCDPFVVAKP